MAGSCCLNLEEGRQNDDEEEKSSIEDRQASKELSVSLEAPLLRGVPLSVALEGCGRHWETPDSGMFHIDPKNYELSRQTQSLDAFLSHDWASSRALKFLSLLIVYNSGPAFWASLGVSLLLGLLRAAGAFPDESWTALLGHLTFLCVLVFWQRLQSPFRRPRMVFLDKLCIAQHDEELKQKGILGLACFVLSAEKLLVLWTPRYLGRLWCNLELAAFLKDPENLRRIQFVPLKSTGVLVMGAVFWHLLAFFYGLLTSPRQEQTAVGVAVVFPISGLMAALSAVSLPLVFYLGLSLMRDLEELPQQLAQFRVQDARCFCCASGHVHPDTGLPLSCDRRLVFKALKKWFGRRGSEGVELDYLDAFNTEVRVNLAPRVVQSMSGGALPFSYTVYMVGACALPYLSNIIPLWVVRLHKGCGYALWAWSLRQLMDWAIVGVSGVFAVRVALELWKLGLRLQKYRLLRARALLVAMLVPLELGLVGICWSTFAYALAATSEASLLPALPFLADVLAILWLFSPWPKGHEAQHQVRRPSTGSGGSSFQV